MDSGGPFCGDDHGQTVSPTLQQIYSGPFDYNPLTATPWNVEDAYATALCNMLSQDHSAVGMQAHSGGSGSEFEWKNQPLENVNGIGTIPYFGQQHEAPFLQPNSFPDAGISNVLFGPQDTLFNITDNDTSKVLFDSLTNGANFYVTAPGVQRTSHPINRFHPYLSTSRQSNYATAPGASAPFEYLNDLMNALKAPATFYPLPNALDPATLMAPATLTALTDPVLIAPTAPAPIAPTASTSISSSAALPTCNQLSQEVDAVLPLKKAKGPEVITSALNFDHYCKINGYDRLPATYRRDRGHAQVQTASTYFQWAATRDFLKEIVGYAGGLDLKRYEIRYDNGKGKAESLTSILLHRLSWNIGTFEATCRVFEPAEHYALTHMWNPECPAISTNTRTASGLVGFDKYNPYETWKAIQYLFVSPGFFINGDRPLYHILNPYEEQVAARVSIKDIKRNMPFIIPNLILIPKNAK
ncbi:hypothetical protein C8J55DRAFT_553952 [Lentinula edodes]|uniref:Uncharacterized protein n=1 Tax=Lentinula lateritia TaxID=40482 RepID=A0A9W9B1V0_9AGAR|nr:hypothetical protein C8J55DRAFT_553952 [Lentinula edodes]